MTLVSSELTEVWVAVEDKLEVSTLEHNKVSAADDLSFYHRQRQSQGQRQRQRQRQSVNTRTQQGTIAEDLSVCQLADYNQPQ